MNFDSDYVIARDNVAIGYGYVEGTIVNSVSNIRVCLCQVIHRTCCHVETVELDSVQVENGSVINYVM